MVPDSTGLYVGMVGWCDIHCKFLSTFRGCVLPNESMCIICILLWTYVRHTRCVIMHFVSFLWMIFCPGILPIVKLSFVSCINIHYTLESVYWSHSKLPLAYVPGWCTVFYFICQVWSHGELSVIDLVSTFDSHLYQSYPLGGHWLIINRGQIFDRHSSDLTELNVWRYKLQGDGLVKTICGRNFHEVWNTFQIHLFDNLMHFRVYIECV